MSVLKVHILKSKTVGDFSAGEYPIFDAQQNLKKFEISNNLRIKSETSQYVSCDAKLQLFLQGSYYF